MGERARLTIMGRFARCAAAVLAAVPLATGCGFAGGGMPGGAESVVDSDTLVIGVNPDQPGLGLRRPDGSYEGFDIEIAEAIAERLGADVTFRPVQSATREEVLRSGAVDLVVASYSITQERKTQVAFAGPYYVAHQDILVRRSDAESIRNVRNLADQRLCQVRGSISYRRVVEERQVPATPVSASGYGDCVKMLASGQVEAVSTDDLILAGLASRSSGQGGAPALRIVNAPFSDEPYGVGIARGDLEGCEAVNKAITEMYQDGTAPRLLRKWFGTVGLNVTTTVPQFEGCD